MYNENFVCIGIKMLYCFDMYVSRIFVWLVGEVVCDVILMC